MRTSIFAFALAFLTAGIFTGVGCGGDDTTTPTVDGGKKDMATTQNPPGDMATTPSDNCGELVQCANQCQDSNCFTKCANAATTAAKTKFTALLDCIDLACPSMATGDGGTAICDGSNATACDACYMDSQAMTGACYSELQACAADM